jgi:hypothetical protein
MFIDCSGDADLAAHGVTHVLTALDGVFRGVHYNSDAEGLVVVVDADNSPIHTSAHDQPGAAEDDCRLCKIRKIIERARKQLKPRSGRGALKVAIGLAVPAIEAWYLAGVTHEVGELPYAVSVEAGGKRFSRSQLKEMVYKTVIPSLELETECAVREARRIAANIETIEGAFPVGFGLMAKEIRSWRST